MSTNSNRIDDSQEVDFSTVSRGIGKMFASLNSFLYRCIRFVVRNIVLLGILFALGLGLGIWMDSNQKGAYNTQIIVQPNFGSVDYLYSKIEMIESKIKDRDTAFLKSIGFKNPKDLSDIKIAPVIDIYKFVNNSGSEQNYRLVELLAQGGDVKKIVSESTTSKNYPYHAITFTTKGETDNESTIAPLLEYLNDNPFFNKIQAQYIENVKIKQRANDSMVAQIDRLLKGFSESGARTQSVYISENTQLNDVLKTKEELIKEQGRHRIDMVGIDKVIKDNSVIANIKDDSAVSGKMKLFLPFLFIGIFVCIYLFRSFYRKQKLKHTN